MNPYISGVASFTQPVLDLFRALFGGLRPIGAAAVAWLVLIVFRGLALPSLNPAAARQAWSLRLGFERITPAVCAHGGVLLFIVFSFISFGIFLFQVWGFALMFLGRYKPGRPAENTREFLYAVARPFSDVRAQYRPWLLLGYGVLIIALMNLAAAGWGAGAFPGTLHGAMRLVWRYAVAAAAGAVDLLLVLRTLLIFLIIGSWIVIFTGAQGLMVMCREWLGLLLGPFRRYPIRLGPIDLTPIIAFFVLGIVHWLVNGNILPILYIALRRAGP